MPHAPTFHGLPGQAYNWISIFPMFHKQGVVVELVGVSCLIGFNLHLEHPMALYMDDYYL